VLTVVTNFLLIPRYGIFGAALGNAISLTVLNVSRYLFLFYVYRLQPFNIRFAFVALVAAASYLISTYLPQLSNYILDIFIRSALVAILFCAPIYFINISEDINNKADEYLRMMKLKK